MRAPNGDVYHISKGSPQVIAALVDDAMVRENVMEVVDTTRRAAAHARRRAHRRRPQRPVVDLPRPPLAV